MADECVKPIHFKTLYESSIVVIRDHECHHGQGGPGPEEGIEEDQIELVRSGAFTRHVGRRQVTSDVNQVVFFPAGSVYRVSHPADTGDRGTSFNLPRWILREIVQELDPAAAQAQGSLLPFVGGPCGSDVYWRHRELVMRLEAGHEHRLEPLWVEVQALQLAADALEAAFHQHGHSWQSRQDRTRASHTDLAEAAKVHMASRMRERVTLDEVARAVETSPFHMARVFQQRTGVSLHRYLTLLRLRAAAERLAAGEADLTSLALDLGFSSHSHFTDAFRREFGKPPSAARRKGRGNHLKVALTFLLTALQ